MLNNLYFLLQRWGIRWISYWHGHGDDATQWRYYRCDGCKGIVTWNDIALGGCDCGMSNKVRPAALTRVEKVRILVLPWSI